MARAHRPKVGFARRRRIYERDGWTCRACGANFADHVPSNLRHAPWINGVGYLQIDHVVPVSGGGSVKDEANMQALCERCNAAKGART